VRLWLLLTSSSSRWQPQLLPCMRISASFGQCPSTASFHVHTAIPESMNLWLLLVSARREVYATGRVVLRRVIRPTHRLLQCPIARRQIQTPKRDPPHRALHPSTVRRKLSTQPWWLFELGHSSRTYTPSTDRSKVQPYGSKFGSRPGSLLNEHSNLRRHKRRSGNPKTQPGPPLGLRLPPGTSFILSKHYAGPPSSRRPKSLALSLARYMALRIPTLSQNGRSCYRHHPGPPAEQICTIWHFLPTWTSQLLPGDLVMRFFNRPSHLRLLVLHHRDHILRAMALDHPRRSMFTATFTRMAVTTLLLRSRSIPVPVIQCEL
jgi:hypothetical protein